MKLKDFRYSKVGGSCHYATNLSVGDYVVITTYGWKSHGEHHLMESIAKGVTIGALFPPLILEGGIGVVGAMGEFGIYAAGQAAVGGVLGGGVAYAMRNTNSNPLGFPDHLKGTTIMPMIGRVTRIDERWWGQPGHDVEVKWFMPDEYGDFSAKTSYHNPSQLFKMKKA